MLYQSVEQLLFHCSIPAVKPKQWQFIIQILRESNLLASCYVRLERENALVNLPEFALKHMKSAYMYSQRQAKQVEYECQEIIKTLKAVEIDPIFLKGASYTLRKSINSRGRVYSDIDILVKKSDIEVAEETLLQQGWRGQKLTRYDDKYFRKWTHEIPPMFHVRRGTVLDLHHHIILPISGRKTNLSLLTADLLTTESGALVLSVEAAILHSAVHLTLNDDVSNAYRDILDIVSLIESHQNDDFWQNLQTLAIKCNFSQELYICLKLANKIAGINCPKEMIKALRGQNNKFNLAKLNDWFIEQVFYYAILPHSQLIQTKHHKIALWWVYLRGHVKKMPLKVLIPHACTKIYFAICDQIFGKHQFDK